MRSLFCIEGNSIEEIFMLRKSYVTVFMSNMNARSEENLDFLALPLLYYLLSCLFVQCFLRSPLTFPFTWLSTVDTVETSAGPTTQRWLGPQSSQHSFSWNLCFWHPAPQRTLPPQRPVVFPGKADRQVLNVPLRPASMLLHSSPSYSSPSTPSWTSTTTSTTTTTITTTMTETITTTTTLKPWIWMCAGHSKKMVPARRCYIIL